MCETDLDRRVAELERAVSAWRALGDERRHPSERGAESLWALAGLEARTPEGAVLYTGSVQTPAGAVVRWQYGRLASDVFAEDWAEHAGQLAALGHPARLRILHAVLHGVVTAAALAEELDAGTVGQIYHHLRELTAAGWLSSPRRGVFEVPASRVVPLLAVLVAAGSGA